MTAAKTMMLSFAHMAGIDMTVLDTEQLALAASNTLDMVHKTISSVIDNGFGFLVWMPKIITIVIVAALILTPVVLFMRCRSYRNKRKMRTKIGKLLTRVNSPQLAQPKAAEIVQKSTVTTDSQVENGREGVNE